MDIQNITLIITGAGLLVLIVLLAIVWVYFRTIEKRIESMTQDARVFSESARSLSLDIKAFSLSLSAFGQDVKGINQYSAALSQDIKAAIRNPTK